MKITQVRRISQLFFLLIFLWLCVVTTVGVAWWQLRGWPVNWFIQLNPLNALALLLTTGTLYAGLAWSAVTIALTVLFGRAFCGWICPLGTLQQVMGWLGGSRMHVGDRFRRNAYHRAQRFKYYLLVFLLSAAVGGLLMKAIPGRPGAWLRSLTAGSLLSGVLDPLSLLQRAVNLAILPWLDRARNLLWLTPRFYIGAALPALLLAGVLLTCLWKPRFYCRTICPLGALLGVLGRVSLWRIGKRQAGCSLCLACEAHCEGACEPAGRIRVTECVLCMNCLHPCPDDLIGYRTSRSEAGERPGPDLTRRGLVSSLVSGLVAVPLARQNGLLDRAARAELIRPPGAEGEEDFLARCIRCGQCMRICPSNIVQPALWEAGVEGLWTPLVKFRMGTAGCRPTCVACGQICPTGALRPLQPEERLGRGGAAPIRMGTAFVDQGRCLPWAMDRPCIVCQENCPVSPKAIYLRETFQPLRSVLPPVSRADPLTLFFDEPLPSNASLAGGDCYVRVSGPAGDSPRRIVEHAPNSLGIDPHEPWEPAPKAGEHAEALVRLQRPMVDPALCIGCGICENVCPLTARAAIRVTAENESRHPSRSFLL